jgi:hypothetical protein
VHKVDSETYEAPQEIALQLGYKDVMLGPFEQLQGPIMDLMAGQPLRADSLGCWDTRGHCVARYSKKFQEQLHNYSLQGYRLQSASVNALVYWWNKSIEMEVVILLPEVVLSKETMA